MFINIRKNCSNFDNKNKLFDLAVSKAGKVNPGFHVVIQCR